MKGSILSIVVVLLLIVGSFGTIAVKTENCGCDNYITNEVEYPRTDQIYPYPLGLVEDHLKDDPDLPSPIAVLGDPPSSWDWRNAEYNGVTGDWTTSIKNQGQCGSCWAFGAIAALESVYNIKSNDPDIDLDLSEQFLVSCSMSFPYNNRGCCGGHLGETLKFMKRQGTVLESCFPYVGIDANGRDFYDCPDKTPSHDPVLCSERCDGWRSQLVKIGTYYTLNGGTSIKNAVSTYGPVVAAFTVYADFYDYTGGVYEHQYGDPVGGHIVAIVGYDDSQQCWICKNSWGSAWGENGFFRIAYGECQIDSPGNSAYFQSCTKSRAYENIYLPFFIERYSLLGNLLIPFFKIMIN